MELFNKEGHLTDEGLRAVVDGTLDEMGRLEASEHLSFCDSCLVRYTELLADDTLLVPEMPLTPTVLARVRRRAVRVFFNRYTRVAAVAAFAVVLWGTGVFNSLVPDRTIRQQEPAALDTPPSEMPVYEPARPVRRVGTLTMGLALVVVGAALCVGLFFPNVDFLLLFKLSPLVLVALGCEVIFAASTAKGMRLKYDFLSMFVCFLLIVTALGAACVPVALQYAGPGRSAAEQRVEQELYEATYARLKGNGDIVNVTYDVHLGELRTPEDVTGAADLKAGDYVGVSAELKGTWATREEFVAACRPVIEAVRATGVRDPYISLYMRESRDTETPLYSLAVEGSYQADMTAEQLAQCVTERIYVDDAGYYMDAEELAGWQSEQSSAARDAELEALEAEWQARLDEAEAAAEQARAEAEERVAQVQAEADERVAQAQADADSRVAEAQANAAA